MTELLVASTRDELRDLGPTGKLIAGGTDLLVQMRAGREVGRLIDVSNMSDAPAVMSQSNGAVELSALAPISRVIGALEGRLPALEASARLFGSIQIRNRATIGGNLQNASPAADMVPPLVAAGATAHLDGPDGKRDVPVAELAIGPGRTVLGPGEWIDTLTVRLPDGEEGFRKLGGREAMAISIVSVAWRWARDEDGTLSGVRVAVGAVAPTVIRAEQAEQELEGRRPAPEVVASAVAAMRAAVSPIDDVRGSAWYRREVAGRLLEEALYLGDGR
ncbi:MAG: FAD binding domain-containing protein [Actinomycetota bacterium]